MDNKLKYSYTKKVEGSFDEIVNVISFALNEEGFSFLTKIDVKEKIKARLEKDIEEYYILGACNPTLAYELLVHEIEIGIFLPCNVIIYKKFGETYVSIIKPSVLTKIVKNKEVEKITKLADEKMKRVIKNISI